MTSGFSPIPSDALDAPLPARFALVVARHPGRPAVVDRHGALTYAELDAESDRLAAAIVARRGPGPEPVALLCDHGALSVAAVLAALKAGKIFAALDPRWPEARLAAVLAHSEAPLVLADAEHVALARATAAAPVEVVDASRAGGSGPVAAPSLAARTLACISYTTGSTGEPKGVVWDHRLLVHGALNYLNGLGIAPTDRLTLLHPVTVAASFRHLFAALLSGAALYPYDVRGAGLGDLAAWLREARITVCHAAASVLRHTLSGLGPEERFPDLRAFRIGSEPAYRRDVEQCRVHFPGARFLHGLGVTEGGAITEHIVDAATPLTRAILPIGEPVPGKALQLVNGHGAEVPAGEIGEIAVRSEFMVRGYWRRPDLDARAFRDDPSGGPARTYLTGDLCRREPDGALVHLGRKDALARLRGRFVEVSAIEAELLAHPAIAGAAVIVREDREGDQRLVAYVVPRAGAPPPPDELRCRLAAALPEAPVPSAFVPLAALPHTANGKLDRNALPAPGRARPPLPLPPTAPRGAAEAWLARIWADVLGLDAIGVDDSLLDLGGHSLLAARIVDRVSAELSVDVPAQVLLEAPTVAAMATAILERWLRTSGGEELDRLRAGPRDLLG